MSTQAIRRAAGQGTGDDAVVEAAWLYYRDGLNQNEIAVRLGVSRATVFNYLQDARERGYVRISLSEEAFTGHSLARELRDAFGLAAAYVLPDGDANGDRLRARVVAGAASWLTHLIAPGDRLGVAWGKTIFDVAECLEPQRIDDLTVLQLVGSMTTPYGFSADVCSSTMARKLGARCVNLHVPAILSDPEMVKALKGERLIADQLAEVSAPNKTVFAAGSCTPDSHVVSSGVATQSDLGAYLSKGAVGVFCGRFIDPEGAQVPGPLDGRMMGVELERLKGLSAGILVSTGADRVVPAVATIRGGFATHIVTSQQDARAMLDMA